MFGAEVANKIVDMYADDPDICEYLDDASSKLNAVLDITTTALFFTTYYESLTRVMASYDPTYSEHAVNFDTLEEYVSVPDWLKLDVMKVIRVDAQRFVDMLTEQDGRNPAAGVERAAGVVMEVAESLSMLFVTWLSYQQLENQP